MCPTFKVDEDFTSYMALYQLIAGVVDTELQEDLLAEAGLTLELPLFFFRLGFHF
jgi:hypothetical protein